MLAGRRVQPALNRVVGAAGPVQVEPKAMAVLLTMAAVPGEVLTRRELLDAVWATEAVSDDVLTRAVGELRKLFDDSSAEPRVIDTIRGRGYRLIASVEPVDTAGDAEARPRTTRPPAAPTPKPAAASRTPWLLAALALAAVVTGFLRFRHEPGPALAPQPGPFRVRALTSSPVQDRDPAVSPDGTAIAYSLRDPETGTADLYLQLLDAGAPLRLTDDPLDDRLPVFSSDATRLAFVRRGEDTCAVHLMAATGGPSRRLVECPAGGYLRLAWSPDDRWLALSETLPEGPPRIGLVLLSLETLEKRRLTDPPPWSADLEPSFSPDGGFLAFGRSGRGGVADVFVVPTSGGEPRRLTDDFRDVAGQTWSEDGRHVVFSSDRGGTYSLWRVGVDGGEPRWISGGGSKIKHPNHARAASVLAYEDWQFEVNLWRLDLGVEGAEPEPLVISTAWDFDPAASPDGTAIAFTSNRSGDYEIWIAAADGTAPRQLTDLGAGFTGRASWSPDGRSLAFVSYVQGRADLYSTAVDGAVPRRLTDDAAEEIAPSWSRDGRHVYFGADRGDGFEIRRVDAAGGGSAAAMTTAGGSVAVESWDGRSLYFTRRQEPGLWRRDLGGATAEAVLPELAADRISRWTDGRDGIYFVDWSSRSPILRLLPWEGGEPRPVAELPDLGRPGFSISADGRTLVFAQVDRADCDIMVARNLPAP